ncbi:DNA-binding protein inhibitor ID-2-like [Anopheles nili]|uniref:DNA-binding protein inhibitor ID-2-like n=1 Tax=Anopheles nili TaxID=185578 RepID=UPI00237ABA57|nr:DNA-binding protein inhibitor ID-2-like [Anopheles nili]
MKAITAVCATGSPVPAIANGRVRQRHREGENDPEIQVYLTKLKDLVPFTAKDRKISKLEVIRNVIDYICELQNTLAHADASSDSATPVGQRQPLGIRPPAPNTILATSSSLTGNMNNNVHTSNTSTILTGETSVASDTPLAAAEISEKVMPSY